MNFDPQILFQQLPLIAKFAVIFGLVVILPRVAEHVGLPWTEKVYGVPPEQVVGSSIKTKSLRSVRAR